MLSHTEDDTVSGYTQNENTDDAFDSEINHHLPLAPEPDRLDEDDGIFMNWPGAEAPADDTEPQDENGEDDFVNRFSVDDDEDRDTDRKPSKKKKKKEKKRKKEEDGAEGEQYTFRRAARSDLEESAGNTEKKKRESDNEATLSSIKYYKYTKKLKQLFVHRFLPLALVLVFVVGFVLFFFRLQHLTFVNLTGYAAEEVFAQTGIKKNMFIFTVNASDIRRRLQTKFPYIQNVSVELDLPDTVNLVFEEDCALFYTQIYDEYFVISESMRVLARYDTLDEIDDNLRAITLPSVSYAVVGHALQFFDSTYIEFLSGFIDTMEESDIYSHITSMDLSNRFDLQLTYEERIHIYLGDSTYLASNLSFVKSIIAELDEDDAGDINIIDNKTASFSDVMNSK